WPTVDDTEPHVGSVAGKPDVMNESVGEVREPPLGEIQELAAADLSLPGVERPADVREKRHDLAIVGEARIQLRAFPGRETAEASTLEWVLPYGAANDPNRRAQGDDDRSRDHPPNPRAGAQLRWNNERLLSA